MRLRKIGISMKAIDSHHLFLCMNAISYWIAFIIIDGIIDSSSGSTRQRIATQHISLLVTQKFRR
jgi:hypothetical protein